MIVLFYFLSTEAHLGFRAVIGYFPVSYLRFNLIRPLIGGGANYLRVKLLTCHFISFAYQ